MVDDLAAALVDALGLGRVRWVGTSMGGALGIAAGVGLLSDNLARRVLVSGVNRGLTREACTLDLRQFTGWCRSRSLSLFSVRRADIETFARELDEAIAETNDLLMEKYVHGEPTTADELRPAIRAATIANKVTMGLTPTVLCITRGARTLFSRS